MAYHRTSSDSLTSILENDLRKRSRKGEEKEEVPDPTS
jgi:hypothetical protein